MGIFGNGSEAGFSFEIKGGPAMEVISFHAYESLSKPFFVDIHLACGPEMQPDAALQKEVMLRVRGAEAERYFHGVVRKFENTGRKGRKHLYHARIVPFCQLLSLEQDCRIFQEKHVQDIVADILGESRIGKNHFEFRLKDKNHRRRYCVQYREGDMDFISRMLYEEGIYYFFEHSEDHHVMVFADDPVCYKPIAGNAGVKFNTASGLNPEKESVSAMRFSYKACTGTYTQTGYNFKRMGSSLETQAKGREDKEHRHEMYDYPGQYGSPDRGGKLARMRLEEQTMFRSKASGSSNCNRMIPGHTFHLQDHGTEAFNGEYLLVEVSHEGRQTQTMEENGGAEGGAYYGNNFLAIPSDVPFRPPKDVKKPRIYGIQSAVVVGPGKEEIYCDEHGRVKVHFPWDRRGGHDEKSSCWVRVTQGWGGSGRGMMFLPRVGEEVLVQYIDGDPDWPVIVGSAYNGDNRPLYDLPGNKTRSTIKTGSYPDSHGFNELRFEDRAGSEEIFIHGEKDWNVVVKNNKQQFVGHDETLQVLSNRTKTVGVDQSESIGANRTIAVGNDQRETIGLNMALSVNGNKTETVGVNYAESVGAAHELTIGGFYQVSVGGAMNETVAGAKTEETGGIKAAIVGADMRENVAGNRTEEIYEHLVIKGDNINIIADEAISTETGAACISMNSGGSIAISGTDIQIIADGNVKLKGGSVAYLSPAESKNSQFAFHKKNQNDQHFVLVDQEDNPIENMNYWIKRPSGSLLEGKTDSSGKTQIIEGSAGNMIDCRIFSERA